jgi:glycosyltransferase involved in cell wall biosynthesis
MRIGLYHGYELSGSGSNEYTRYLARTLVYLGHEVHIICREPSPENITYISKAYAWNKDGSAKTIFSKNYHNHTCVLHQLPNAEVRPVFLTDKQREGNVKSFVSLSSEELAEYHKLNKKLLYAILSKNQMDVLQANHLIYQPVVALEVCEATNTPLIIYPHGSSIEYVIKSDDRYRRLALKAILGSAGLIIGNREVRDRIINLYPEHKATILSKTKIVGVGVDTTLFKPLKKNGRVKNIQNLINTEGKGGKSPELTKELFVRLQNMDIKATQEYWNKYNFSLPDEDLNFQLEKIPWNNKILLYVGALTAGKGLQSLITALPFILSHQPDTHLIIVGAGTYREVLQGLYYAIKTSHKSLLIELCKKGMDLDRNELAGPWEDVQLFLNNKENFSQIINLGKLLENHVHFLGRLDHSRLKFIFPCADLSVFPSIIPEAYPLVLMESLSNGVLPIVSYFSGFKEGVDELEAFLPDKIIEKMKISVNPETRINSIISNISSLLAEPDLKQNSSNLREIAVEHYDWRIRANQMVHAFSSIISIYRN